jgi:hypothetical protein
MVSKYVDRGSSDSDLMSDAEREAARGSWAAGPRQGLRVAASASQQARASEGRDGGEDEDEDEAEAEELENALRMVADMERKDQRRRQDKGASSGSGARSLDDGEEREERKEGEEQLQRHRLDPDTKRILLDMLALLQNEDSDEIFARPVNPDDAPGYGLLVPRPMDLGTVRTKLQNRLYAGAADLVADVRLCFDNCLAYNEPSSYYAEEAKRLRLVLDREVMAAGF